VCLCAPSRACPCVWLGAGVYYGSCVCSAQEEGRKVGTQNFSSKARNTREEKDRTEESSPGGRKGGSRAGRKRRQRKEGTGGGRKTGNDREEGQERAARKNREGQGRRRRRRRRAPRRPFRANANQPLWWVSALVPLSRSQSRFLFCSTRSYLSCALYYLVGGCFMVCALWCVACQGASLLYGVCSLRWEASPGALCAYGVWGRCCVVCVVYGVSCVVCVVYALCSSACGVWCMACMVYGAWCIAMHDVPVHSVSCLVSGVWCLVYCVGSMVCAL
jgi:hypothetical protein